MLTPSARRASLPALVALAALGLGHGTSLAQQVSHDPPRTRAERRQECLAQCDRLKDMCLGPMRRTRQECSPLDARCRLNCEAQFGDHPGGTVPVPVNP